MGLRVSRRHFLSSLAVLGIRPVWADSETLGWFQDPAVFTGDDFELAHRLLQRPGDVLAQGTAVTHPEPYDAIVVGGGVAGLTTAYRLRKRRVLLLERDARPGGVAKLEAWQGIEYALGAAYIIDPDPDSEDEREKAGFDLLSELGLRQRDEDLTTDRSRQRRLSGDDNHCVFSNRRIIPEAEVFALSNRRFFAHVLDSDNYPSVPPSDEGLVATLDRVSFAAFLRDTTLQRKVYGRTVGAIPPLGWEAIEYYCWGAFGTTAEETSAYHGLNFYAAEFGDVLVYPGGNGYITRRLAERIARDNPTAIKTGAWTLRVERDGRHFAATTWEHGTLHRYRARALVFSAPLFLAPVVMPWLPAEQRKAIGTLRYRAYAVANVLLKRPASAIFRAAAFRNGYELTRVHGIAVGSQPSKTVSSSKVYSDAILADFPAGRHPTHAVLTVYRPYPYEEGRVDLMGASYEAMASEVRRELLEGFGAHGLRAEDIEGIRISRWGHPMIVTRPGQMADGTLRSAAQSQPGLYFAHTDVQGAPAYENALASAFAASDAVAEWLAR
jgi:hypothetical protein